MSRPTERRGFFVALVAVLLVAAAVRIPAIFDAFWLDEIWSWSFARRATSVLDIVRLAHDNNHWLNTLFLYLLGDREGWWTYRLLSLASGLGAVAVAMVRARRDGLVEAVTSGLLLALSYMMVLYSTEARGYAPAVLVAFGTLPVLERALATGGWTWCGAFWVLTALGLAAHLSFLHFYLALLAWSAWHAFTPPYRFGAALERLLRCHAAPLLYLALLYATTVRHLRYGGGPPWHLGQLAQELVAWTLGTPLATPAVILAGAGATAVLVASCVLLHRQGSDLWVFDLAAIAVVPALTARVLAPEFVYPRYFLLSIAFFLLALGRVLARMFQRGRASAVAAVLLLATVLAGNLTRIVPFLEYGRGQYAETLRYLREHTEAPMITLASDHDFDTLTVVSFYGRHLDWPKPLRYFRHEQFPPEGTEWFLVQSFDPQPEPSATLRLAGDDAGAAHDYLLERSFPYFGASGWHWFLYHRQDG